MRYWYKKLSVFVLLLVLPLQGAAAVLMPLACLTAPTHNATAGAGAHHHVAAEIPHQHDALAGASYDQSNDDGVTGPHYNGHLLCHLFSAVPATVIVVAAADLPDLNSSISIPIALFVPEQPQRPPRS